MGPLAGVGDPVFWFTARPMLGALGASRYGRKHLRTNLVLRIMERNPLGIYVVYTGIWLPGW